MKKFLALLILSLSASFVYTGCVQADATESKAGVKYVCPMHPQIVRDHPGTCPICGMKLVAQQIEESSQSQPVVGVSGSALGGDSTTAGVQQGLAIKTAKVQRTTLWKYIETYGMVAPDETKVIHIHPFASGWISELAVRDNGEQVKKGQLLYRFYSPEIVSAQQDLVLAKQNVEQIGKSALPLLKSARTRLDLLGLDRKTIRQIEKTGKVIHKIPVYAPQSGVIDELSIQPGMYIQPMTELMSISDLSQVWVIAQVLPLQQSWVKKGKTVEVSTERYPGEAIESFIDYLYPQLDVKTKNLKARIPLRNVNGHFSPNQPVNVTIYGGPKRNVLVIPRSAVVDDGKTKRVVKVVADGRFQVVEMTPGMQSGDFLEVKSGLKEGDTIVTSGQFLIDSESQIKANLLKLIQAPKKDQPASGFEKVEPA